MEKDKQKLVKKEKEIEELTNNWKRALADYQNLEKRFASEKQELVKVANGILILRLLGPIDNLTKAAKTLKDTGLDMVAKQFNDVLVEFGIASFGNVGEKFDPALHEVVSTDQERNKDEIVEVYEKGYLLNNKVLRPARVSVGQKNG